VSPTMDGADSSGSLARFSDDVDARPSAYAFRAELWEVVALVKRLREACRRRSPARWLSGGEGDSVGHHHSSRAHAPHHAVAWLARRV